MILSRQFEVLRKIPRESTGKIPNKRLRELDRLLRRFSYNERELEILEREVVELRGKWEREQERRARYGRWLAKQGPYLGDDHGFDEKADKSRL